MHLDGNAVEKVRETLNQTSLLPLYWEQACLLFGHCEGGVCNEAAMSALGYVVWGEAAVSAMLYDVCGEGIKCPRNDAHIITPKARFESLRTVYN